MKALFLIFHGLSPTNGISKKIQAQVKALNECGVETALCHYGVEKNGSRVWKCDEQVIVNLGKGFIAKLKKRFYLRPLLRYIINNQISFIYIRSDHNANPFTISFIRSLRQHGIKVLMEIPTYPYDQEYITFESKCHLLIDKLFRSKLASFLNAIITFSNQKEIFGQRTIQISNGIDFDSIPLKRGKEVSKNEIHLIGVAEIHYWHGYDRLIAGMVNYYQSFKDGQKKIVFHLVGNFSGEREREEILPLIEVNHLNDYVILHGALHGNDLTRLFDMADIGIGSLARHRSHITHIKTLKNREYAARGIPFIYSEIDEDFEMMPYVIKAPADETPIDIDALIDFYNNQNWTSEKIRKSIDSLSWTNQMQTVIDNIN
ncbi:glycosyltransferase [Massilibacteroides sp.]|uniref:glycosyltransferase n=1 Tax=Massilibacteroides sp. TaxID=2034766 RepID=UPI002625292C|nr:glycosyltransferase [Massilibacteroides sp.]MDD4514748.1 glycosyltransferase [Massilibacteroides sp.]